MTPQDFAYWLQGFFEIADPKTLDEKQLKIVKNHLNLVFHHSIDPSYTDDKKEQEVMNNIHNGNYPHWNDDSNGTLIRC